MIETPGVAAAHGHTGVVGELADALAGLEVEHHARGWDNSPPTLYMFGRHVHGGLDAVACRMGVMTGMHPREELAALAWAMENGHAAELMALVANALPVAFGMVMEMWTREHQGDRESFDADRAGRMLADMPGSVECRIGLAVMGKRRLIVRRRRGFSPEWFGENWDQWGGGMVESLVRVQAAARSLAAS